MTDKDSTPLCDTAGYDIPDVQSSADTRQIAIDKVGIKDVR
ncbi:MAG: GTP cyclohydrolase I FolE2, partial [Gammaproteobacteria bacterium]